MPMPAMCPSRQHSVSSARNDGIGRRYHIVAEWTDRQNVLAMFCADLRQDTL